MTTANKVTIGRILLIPFFVYQFLEYRTTHESLAHWLCLGSFAAISILDGVDGFIARRFNQRSELGAALDPLADKLLLTASIILLSLNRSPFVNLPLWLTALILSRDVLIGLGAGVIYFTCGKIDIRPRVLGKIATVANVVIVIWALCGFSPKIQSWMTIVVALLTVVSGLQYLSDGIRQLNESPRSAASPKQ
ncbi:MAG TPA: CDP-alcohol phosphatidyltransferase family protein [Candidatus Limnocylindria bacterium]|nr:CDP-alcohol phosphatidyltransferase family protein [Candidatus Limnocylindria bacterium]